MEPRRPPCVLSTDGDGLVLHPGEWLLGRGGAADLRLLSDAVSVEHAWIRGDGSTSWIRDAGSTNGTFVNARRLGPVEERRLRDGDRIRLGAVTVTYHDGTHREAAPTRARPDGARFTYHGDVVAGTINNAGRDVHNRYDNRRRIEYHTPEGAALTELSTGLGLGRVVLAMGLLLVVAGFAAVAWGVLGFITTIAAGGGSDLANDPPSPLGPEVLGGIPLGVLGFAAFGIGGVLTVIGTAMSRAARHRARPDDGW